MSSARTNEVKDPRILVERPLPKDGRDRAKADARKCPARSLTVNLSESPLAWLHARGPRDAECN